MIGRRSLCSVAGTARIQLAEILRQEIGSTSHYENCYQNRESRQQKFSNSVGASNRCFFQIVRLVCVEIVTLVSLRIEVIRRIFSVFGCAVGAIGVFGVLAYRSVVCFHCLLVFLVFVKKDRRHVSYCKETARLFLATLQHARMAPLFSCALAGRPRGRVST